MTKHFVVKLIVIAFKNSNKKFVPSTPRFFAKIVKQGQFSVVGAYVIF
jgi:hypothetical protein